MMKHKCARFVLMLVLLFTVSFDAISQSQSEVVSALVRVDPTNQKSSNVVGMTPEQIRRAYGFDQVVNQGLGQTIAIVVAFENPTIEDDLAVFSSTFNLPSCTTANGCFKKVGTPPPPDPNNFPPSFVETFQLEAALDVQWAHAIAPKARKVLMQADTAFLSDMLAAVDKAVYQNGANVVSMSWGLPESRDRSGDYSFVASNVSFVAASGDSGNPALYPATSRDVTAVGGTKLNVNSQGDYSSEHSWSESGGGLSTFVFAAPYQLLFTPTNPLGKRGMPDVAYNGDPQTGVAVYSSLYAGGAGWTQVGGTSAGAPQWSALIAIVNSMRSAAGKSMLTGGSAALYGAAVTSYSEAFNDVKSGPNNGQCGPLCKVDAGYDYLTGLGTPRANALISVLVNVP